GGEGAASPSWLSRLQPAAMATHKNRNNMRQRMNSPVVRTLDCPGPDCLRRASAVNTDASLRQSACGSCAAYAYPSNQGRRLRYLPGCAAGKTTPRRGRGLRGEAGGDHSSLSSSLVNSPLRSALVTVLAVL